MPCFGKPIYARWAWLASLFFASGLNLVSQEYQGKIYWHEAFYEALQLELYQYKVINMTEGIKEVFLAGAEKYGWFDETLNEKLNENRQQERKIIAKKMLLMGISIEKVAEATELSIETVAALQKSLH